MLFIYLDSTSTGLSLSHPRLSRITAYLEVKIWSPFKHENLTTKYCGKEEKLLLRSNFSSFLQYFLQYFQCISNFRSQIIYSFVKCGCSIYFFLNSANLICRGTDISKYFRGSLGLRDNGSQLYFPVKVQSDAKIALENIRAVPRENGSSGYICTNRKFQPSQRSYVI